MQDFRVVSKVKDVHSGESGDKMSYIASTYNRYPIQISHAKGIKVWDTEGKEYFDTFMGIGVLLFGHNHERIISAMREKLQRYTHISNFFLDEDAEIIAERLVKETKNEGKVFFTNSGAESTECALKVIRKYRKQGKIVSFIKNFHGRTLKALSITGFENIRKQFVEDQDVVFLPYNVDVVYEFFKQESKIAAVFVEVVHGSGGLDLIPTEIVEIIQSYKAKKNFLIVADEVQSGLGRTGKFYAYQYFDISPDLVTVAKGIGGGLPLGACLMLNEYSDAFEKGEHGSTFAPNPVALAAGKAVLEMITEEVLQYVEKVSIEFENRFYDAPYVETIKGLGLMRGIVLKNSFDLQINDFIKEGLLVNILGNGVIRFLLPLNVTLGELREIRNRFDTVFLKNSTK